MSRRRLIGGMLVTPAATVLLNACGGESTSTGSTATTGATSTSAATGTSTTGAVPATAAWASGGTDPITVDYPATSIFANASTCELSLTPAETEGPCYFQSDTGEDIPEGRTGLPMQLAVQLVDTGCAPLEGYTIEVWHCDTAGIYSGDTSDSDDAARFAGSFCTADDAEAVESTWFRGQLTTDADGRVNFKTCFPGWYAGRTIHIHFAVTDPDGTTRVISQWCFPDEFTEEICTTHDLYADRGAQDTPLGGGTDTVFPADDYDVYLLDLEQNSDGTLLGYGVIQIDPTAVATESGSGGGGTPPGGGNGAPPASPDQDT